ncbi:MAG: hypothetical protein WBE26_20245 [Phycisphaerae bacterium]
MFPKLTMIIGLLGVASVAQAGAVVELVPDDPGPYYGGESLTVDFWLHSDRPYDVRLRSVQFSFLDTDPALRLDPTFVFDFSSLAAGDEYALTFPDLPIPRTGRFIDCLCPERYLLLPGDGSLHIGALGVELPTDQGVYRLDALNGDEPDALLSAYILAIYTDPHELWRAFTGDITGGAYDFTVVPEPTTLSFLILGGLALLTIRRTKSTKPLRAGICALIVVLGFDLTVMGQPALIPGEKLTLNVDSGPVSATAAETDDPVVVFSEVVSVEGAPWLRLHLAEVTLAGVPHDENESFLRITSQEDGAVQVLDSFALTRWKNTSAYFNGDSVLVELLAYAGTGENRVVIDKLLAGSQNKGEPEHGMRSSSMDCEVDDRTASEDPRAGRFGGPLPVRLRTELVTLLSSRNPRRSRCSRSAGWESYAAGDHKDSR